MQFLSQFFCRLFRQPSSFLGLAASLSLLAAVMLASLSTGAEEAPAPGAQDSAGAKPEREGGFTIQVPESPPLVPLPIGYLREVGDHPRPASRLDVEPKDAGIAGAKMAVEENNAGGRFTGHAYTLDVSTVASPEKAVEALKKFYESGHNYVVVDASADTLLKLSDWAKDKDILLFNVSATDVSLRQENCRVNVMHIVPDRYMLADALAQYLVTMKWTNWLLVHGSTPGDLAYADAIKRAAGRFGATIVDVREYKDNGGADAIQRAAGRLIASA
ncbi:MAG: ABC transporter substrate-binding protein [Methyloceanibacter sp.]|nr:ABC transporter substrate-binding protein [Methyloceanibacter sp.]